MLTPCLTCSRSRSQPCKPRCAHARIWCSRTCSYAINSPCSPGRRDADRMLGCASGTTCCRSSLVDSAPTGEHLSFVTLETVVRWHRQGWRLFWRWKYRSRGGRPQDLIATMSRDNRLWGTERIRGQFARGRACAPVDHWCASQGTAAHLQGPQVVIEKRRSPDWWLPSRVDHRQPGKGFRSRRRLRLRCSSAGPTVPGPTSVAATPFLTLHRDRGERIGHR